MNVKNVIQTLTSVKKNVDRWYHTRGKNAQDLDDQYLKSIKLDVPTFDRLDL